MVKSTITPSRRAWFLVMQSKDLRPGEVKSINELQNDLLIYRTETGVLKAISRYCPHLETDLIRSKVNGENLVCPLHSWEFDITGSCTRSPNYKDVKRRLGHFSICEKLGAIFVSMGRNETFNIFNEEINEDDYIFRNGQSLEMNCPWHAIAANGYDTHHFETIHQRFFHQEPTVQILDQDKFQIDINAGASGTRLLDVLIRKLGKNKIKVRIINYTGTILIVESDVGFMKSILLISLSPNGNKTHLRSIMGIRKKGFPLFNRIILWLVQQASNNFLKDDLGALSNLRMRPNLLMPEDRELKQFYEWLPSREKRSRLV